MNAVVLCAWLQSAHGAAPAGLQLEAIWPEWTVQVDDSPLPTEPWWTRLGDPTLDRAVEAGLAANPDLMAAQARLDAARGAALGAISGLLPGASFDISAAGQPLDVVFRCAVGPIDPAEFGSIGQEPADDGGLCWTGNALLNLRWSLDLFGRTLLGHQAARHDVAAAEADRAAARLAISGGIANAYLDAVAADLQVAILEDQLQSQSDLLEILELRYAQGGASGLDVLQQRQSVASTRASLPTAAAAAERQRRVLAALMGAAEAPPLATDLPEGSPLPPLGQPADLTDRRPDLQAASARAAAARARHAASVRGLLPTVSVSANTGWSYAQSDEFSSIGTWGLGANLSVPLFNGGATHGAIRQAAGGEVAAVRAWDTALLSAVRDVHNAVILDQRQAERHEAVALQLAAARQAHGEAQDRYLTGIDSFLNVLAAQGSLQGAELSLVSAHRDRLAARVQLWTTLGGNTDTAGANP